MNQYYVNQDSKDTTKRLTILRVANTLFFLLTIGFNFLAQALPLNRKTTGELAGQYPNLFTPANVTFSIWSVIYLALLLFIGWQLWPLRNTQRAAQRNTAVGLLGWDFVGLSVLNMAWLFCWHYEWLSVSVLVMLLLLGLLIRMNRLIFNQLAHSVDHRNFLQIPFGLYAGWISVATITNITVWLVDRNWDRFGLSEKIWTEIMLLVAILLALSALYMRRNIPFAVAVIWALFGIALKHQALFDTSVSLVILTAYAGMLLLLIAAFTRLRGWWLGALPSDVHQSVPTVY